LNFRAIYAECFIGHFLKFVKKLSGKDNNTGSLILLCIGLVAIILSIYMQVGNHQFLNLDDNGYVTSNPHVAGGITGENIIWAFTSLDEVTGNWHPVTWLSHMADVQLYGMNPRGHHLTNVVIHTISSLLLLLFLFRFTSSLWQSSFVAALFALHPLHVESVAWVAERKDVLCAFFWLLTLLFYCEYVAKRKPALYILSLFSFVLGLMAKPMLVTLPIVMLLMDFWPLRRYWHGGEDQRQRRDSGRLTVFIKEKIPFFIFSLASSVITIYAQNKGGAIKSLDVIPIGLRTENALLAYIKYIAKTLWPRNLAVLYPLSPSIPIWQAISSLLVLLLMSAAVVRARHRRPYLMVGWFWFLVTLVPVIGLIQVGGQSMADRYTYIPVIGLFIMVAWGAADLTRNLQHQKVVLALLAGVVISASAALTWQQLGYWRDNISLFRHTLQVTTGNYLINNNLGIALAEKGDLDAAIREYRTALGINPNYADAHYNLGNAFIKKRNPDAAIQEYQETLLINPNHSGAHYSLGAALANKGNLDAAIQEYRMALRLNPNDAKAHTNLGVALANKGNLDAAIQEFQEVLRISPNDAKAQKNLGIALAQKRKQDENSGK
jgi:tetratricopeptide (TPR) repeat protein